MKTKEILEVLDGMTMSGHSHAGFFWAQQLAKDLRVAVEALKKIKNASSGFWDLADNALREIDL
jgi:hypothetical protein